MSRIAEISQHGQSIWYDYIQRSMIWTGRLHRMAAEDDLRGVTSNPAIFQKAIGGSTDYAGAVRSAVETGRDAIGIFEQIAIQDIQLACDTLRSVYDRTEGKDGFVSLEVSPHLAHDTQRTIAQAERLWAAVRRDNLMIKVPATPAGIPAIQHLIAEGMNINVTLLFAVDMYEQVFEAYQSGLETRAKNGLPIDGVATVASFFVSRIDSLVDKLLDERKVEDLKGKVAIANAKMAYRSYERLSTSPAWKALAGKGAQPQRLLWASTSTKDPSYRDVLYIEELIGPDTVNTVPEATYDAFNDHGVVASKLTDGMDEAADVMKRLAGHDVSMKQVTDQLLDEGVVKFQDAFDKLLATVEQRRKELVGSRLVRMSLSEVDGLDATLESQRSAGFTRRLFDKDATLFGLAKSDAPAAHGYMGWLDALDGLEKNLDALESFAGWVKDQELAHVVLMGMGGSSLAPDVFRRTFASAPGHPELLVLDSTAPAQVAEIEAAIDPKNTLFIVSSKSGTTTEPLSFLEYFWDKAKDGSRFACVTDPGSKLEALAKQRGFSHVFLGDPEIGGRYSALSPFGMVPAAAMGLDVRDLVERARLMVNGCAASVPPADNDGVRLGEWLAAQHKAGRDKLTLVSDDAFSAFGVWVEQLVAESVGKNGVGVVPVDGEPELGAYGDDRVFCVLGKDRDLPGPKAVVSISDPLDLVQEMYRWEIATATLGAALGINPFDQPNVQESKTFTKDLLAAFEKNGALPEAKAMSIDDPGLGTALEAHLALAKGDDYVAINAFLPMNEASEEALQKIRIQLAKDGRRATTVGFGPRFLHSTGQLHKGGKNNGVFIQLTCDGEELAIPGAKYGFQTLVRAQAIGDAQALESRGRRLLKVHLNDPVDGLKKLAALIA